MFDRLDKSPVSKIKTYGNSMSPFLRDGDIINLKKSSFFRIKVNDFITFQKNNKFITHRVIFKRSNISKPYLITKGDTNFKDDGKIYPQQIIGKIKNVRRAGKIIDPELIYQFQSSIYFQEILKVKDILEEKKLDFVFLKGLPLHLYFEKTYSRRLYVDCDVLIRKKDFKKVQKILLSLGYKKNENALSDQHKNLKDKQTEVDFYKIINGFRVTFDVHLEAVFLMTQLGSLETLYPQKLIDQMSDDLLNEKTFVTIDRIKFPILSKENLIIYLALHLFHHNFRGYYRYHFLKIILQLKNLDYSKIKQKIVNYKVHTFVYPVFRLLKKYYQTSLPKNFLAQIKPGKEKLIFVDKNIMKINIFEDEPRIKSGVARFKFIFYLSPFSSIRKSFIIFNKQVLYSLIFIIRKQIEFRRPL